MTTPPHDPDRADLWHAYDRAQAHYDSDLQLFSSRMNLFLLVQSALVAVAAGSSTSHMVLSQSSLAIFSLVLCIGWLLVAFSSYQWIKILRAHMSESARQLESVTGVVLSPAVFQRPVRQSLVGSASFASRLLERTSWYVRPTLVTCCLPLLFMVGWIYIGWIA